jgi:hypothetical protein
MKTSNMRGIGAILNESGNSKVHAYISNVTPSQNTNIDKFLDFFDHKVPEKVSVKKSEEPSEV